MNKIDKLLNLILKLEKDLDKELNRKKVLLSLSVKKDQAN